MEYGKFSIKSCYAAINEEDGMEEENWNCLWKLHIPRKLIFFLWMIRHGKNLSNHQRMTRGMDTTGTCKLCGALENNDHIFRYCPRATEVWCTYPSSLMINNFAIMDFKAWLDINVKSMRVEQKKPSANRSLSGQLTNPLGDGNAATINLNSINGNLTSS
ncbi:hypothetical protein LguiA_032594 [Lonicera macranthoides]